MSDDRVLSGLAKANTNGGYYHPGKEYDFSRKLHVWDCFISLLFQLHPQQPSIAKVAREAKVSWDFAKKLVEEVKKNGCIIDPTINNDGDHRHDRGSILTHEESIFLLALRVEDPHRSNLEYIEQLFREHGKIVSSSLISKFFNQRFGKSGRFRKPNLIPLDKWKPENLGRFARFHQIISGFPDHRNFHFLDEKHICNKDVVPNRVRADPLSGYVPYIKVSGDFWDAFNIFCMVTCNPQKNHCCFYSIQRNNGTSESFMQFLTEAIFCGYLVHDEIIIMDNAAIHSKKAAKNVQDFLWNCEVDDRPLHVLIIWLPTRAPELNLIELIFHIFARQLRSFCYRMGGVAQPNAVLHQAQKVLDELTLEDVLKCCIHCGY